MVIEFIDQTAEPAGRFRQHRIGEKGGFSKRYKTYLLVHFEVFDDIQNAIAREKAMKKWRRDWKIELIEQANPDWRDRYDEII